MRNIFWDKSTELYIYKTVDWVIGAWIEVPTEQTLILTTRNLTKEVIFDILNNWNMSVPTKIINEIKSKYITP